MNNWIESGRSLVYIISVLQFVGGVGMFFMGVSFLNSNISMGFMYLVFSVIYILVSVSLWKFVKYFDSFEIVE